MLSTGGPVAEKLQSILCGFEIYRDYQSGKISHSEYVRGLESNAEELEEALGGPRNLRLLASRYPSDFDRHADEILAEWMSKGLVSETPSNEPLEDLRERMSSRFSFGEFTTYIHPDEARLAYLVSMARPPKRLVVIGSYFGYWAIWAMPGVEKADGKAMLIDPNPEVCALAEGNFKSMGYGDRTTVRADKAEDILDEMLEEIDLVLLDAAGSFQHPDPAYRGKGIYAFMVEGVFSRMRDGGLMAVHNDYLADVGVNKLSKPFVDRSVEQLARFHEFCDSHFKKSHVAATPDGFGLYLK